MKWKKTTEDFFRDRFNYLLILIVLLLLTAPFLRLGRGGGLFPLLYGVVFVVSNLFILKIMITGAARFWATAALFIAIFIFDVTVKLAGATWSEGTMIVTDLAYVAFIAIFLNYLFRALFNEKKVTPDSIKGGICVYFLLGILWGVLYRALEFFDPSAFVFQGETSSRSLFYFSYVTLTTVGYGDIVPASRLAETLAFMEAVTGQIFLAVFIARLMGLHIAHEINHKNSEP